MRYLIEHKFRLKKVLATLLIIMIAIPSITIYSQTDIKLDFSKGYFKDQTIYYENQYITANFFFYWNSYIKLVDLLKAYPNYTCKVYDNKVDIYKDNKFLKQFSLGNLTSDEGFIYNGRIYLNCIDAGNAGLPVDSRTVPDELYHPEGLYVGECGTIEIYPDLQEMDLSQYIDGWPMQQVRMAKFDIVYKDKQIQGTYPIASAFEGYIMNPNIIYVYIDKGHIDYHMNILELPNEDYKIEFSSQDDMYHSERLVRIQNAQ